MSLEIFNGPWNFSGHLLEGALLASESVVLGDIQILHAVKVVVLVSQPAENSRILVVVGGRVDGLAKVLDLW